MSLLALTGTHVIPAQDGTFSFDDAFLWSPGEISVNNHCFAAFSGVVEGPMPEMTLTYFGGTGLDSYDPVTSERVSSSETIAVLRRHGMITTALRIAHALMAASSEQVPGPLLWDGYGNVFHVVDRTGRLCQFSVERNLNRWLVLKHEIANDDDGARWCRRVRFFAIGTAA